MSSFMIRNMRGAAAFLREQGVVEPEVGIILGSGSNSFADRLENKIRVPYSSIPDFYTGEVDGHRGELIYGKLDGKNVVIMAGRFHYYEGHSMTNATFPTGVMIELGIKRIIVTNAAGCINTDWKVNDIMLISDHINMSGDNPLIGPNLGEHGVRFPDMSDAYCEDLRTALKAVAKAEGIDVKEGVYAMMTGPSFETPAEIRMLRVLGADAVGMSTVPEVIVANQARLEVIGISLLTNMAAGILKQPLTGAEVTENARLAEDKFYRLIDLAISID